MIDDIYAMIIKEAKARPGKDFQLNLYTVLKELGKRLIVASDHILESKRKEAHHEE